MKSYIVLSILLCCSFILVGQDSVLNEYETIDIATIPTNLLYEEYPANPIVQNSSDDGFLSLDYHGRSFYGPNTWFRLSNGNFVVLDEFADVNNFAIFDDQYSFIKRTINPITLNVKYYNIDDKIIGMGYGNYYQFDQELELRVHITMPESVSKNHRRYFTSFITIGDLVIGYAKDGDVWGWINPGKDHIENWNRKLNIDQISKLFVTPEEHGLADYTLRSDNTIFYKEKLITFDFETYINYWKSYYGDGYSYSHNPNWTNLPIASWDPFYVSTDDDGNQYWIRAFSQILVFNKFGYLIDFIQLPLNDSYWPFIDSAGNIYYRLMRDYDLKNHGFYYFTVQMIKRTW